MKSIEKNKEKIKFAAEVSESLANAVRRYVYQIPVLAIDELEIKKNYSPLYDEMLAHRVGLIPLQMKKNAKSGKMNLKTKKEGMIYSGDLSGSFKVAYEEIPLVSLEKGQELEFEASVVLGTGAEHAKFCPGIIVYKNLMSVKETKKTESAENFGNLENVKKEELVYADDFDGVYLDEDSNKGLELSPKEEELLITVESFGQISPEEIFREAIETLKKDLVDVGKKVLEDR